jgi:hypothetical protein
MPAFLLHAGAVLNCPHPPGVVAIPAPTQQRVLVSGCLVAVTTDQIMVAGCGLAAASLPPCATVIWANTSVRVLIDGRPPLLQAPPGGSGNGACVGSAPPAIPIVVSMQSWVTGS